MQECGQDSEAPGNSEWPPKVLPHLALPDYNIRKWKVREIKTERWAIHTQEPQPYKTLCLEIIPKTPRWGNA